MEPTLIQLLEGGGNVALIAAAYVIVKGSVTITKALGRVETALMRLVDRMDGKVAQRVQDDTH